MCTGSTRRHHSLDKRRYLNVLVVKILRLTDDGTPMVRIADGRLFPAGPQLCAIALEFGDIAIFTDRWEIGDEADWEALSEVGVVDSVFGDKAILRRKGVKSERAGPTGVQCGLGQGTPSCSTAALRSSELQIRRRNRAGQSDVFATATRDIS